jgi:DNA-binding SARP family transcriptional activator
VRLASLRLGSLAMAAVSLAAIGLLWRFRPEWPDLPDSLSSPVTTAFLQQLAVMAAWLLAALVILLLLVQILGDIRARRRLDLGSVALNAKTRESSRLRRPGSTLGILRPLVAEPKLFVVAPREATPSEESSDQPAPLADAEPDDRPLISLLGPLAIYGGKRSRRGLRARALEVIAFLALRREGAQRDEILEALWPGDDPKRSRHRLYQAVRDARQLLGEAVTSERDRYWLDRDRIRVDVDELEGLLGAASRADGNRRLELLEKALALFRDEPLAGSDFPWCEGDVRRLAGAYIELLEEVGRARLRVGDGREALGAAERGLAVDVLNESLWRLALEAEGRLGLRESIKARYERLCALLDERLGLEPAQETRALYLRLLGPA